MIPGGIRDSIGRWDANSRKELMFIKKHCSLMSRVIFGRFRKTTSDLSGLYFLFRQARNLSSAISATEISDNFLTSNTTSHPYTQTRRIISANSAARSSTESIVLSYPFLFNFHRLALLSD